MCTTYRISVGVNPRVNAFIPSVLQVVLTQSNVDLYFCPVAGENPSVCIRDLIISIGYMTAQSYYSSKSKNIESKNQGSGNEIGTRRSYRISGRSAEQDCFGRVHLVPSDSLLRDLPLHKLFVGPEINPISAGFTEKSRDLSLVNPGDPVGSVNLFDGIPRTGVKSDFIRLGLQTCGRERRRVNRGAALDGRGRFLRSSLNKNDLRIRMCSTGPDTTEFARPAMTPEAKYCDPVKGPSPLPDAMFRAENIRFEYSRPANWIETHRPIPSNGVKVPCNPAKKSTSETI